MQATFSTEPEQIWGLTEDQEGGNVRIVKVNVIRGNNLAKKDIFGLSDPYCVIQQLDKLSDNVLTSLQTRVKKKTLNPVWNSSFLLRVDTEQHCLLFKIFDENRLTRDDFLGEAEVKLNDLCTEGEPDSEENGAKYYNLAGRSHKSRVRGTIKVSLLLLPPESVPPSPDVDDADGAAAFQIARDFNRLHSIESIRSQTREPGWETVEEETHNNHPHADHTDTQDVLPSNWEERQDANGRTFYVNHDTRSTTWNRPTVEVLPLDNSQIEEEPVPVMARDFVTRRHISQEDDQVYIPVAYVSTDEDVEEEEALPPGWEERRDVNERTLYINHNNRTTTWTRPSLSRVSAIDEEESMDASFSEATAPSAPIDVAMPTGPATPTVPAVPTAPLTAPPSPPATSAQAIPAGAMTDRSSTQTVPPSASPPSTPPTPEGATAMLDPSVPSPNESPLPPGWAMQTAPNGRMFFIDHNTRKTSWVDPRTNPGLIGSGLGELHSGWEQRCHSDGRIFFIDHSTQSTQWEDPRLQSKAKEKTEALPYSRDYKRKYDYFRQRLKPPENVPNKYEIHVRRKNLLEDSFRFVFSSCKNVELLKTKLWIVFDGETGLDYGGVSREWFYLLSKEIFNPYYGLFEYSATDNYTLQINPNSAMCNDQHLSYFKFIGRVAGMAVYHGKLLDAFFIRPFYKMLLVKKITLQDLESVDSEYHNSLKWLMENDPEVLDLTFVIEEDVFGQYISRELRPHGSNIPVTNSNKMDYIDLVIKWRFIDRVRDQMKSFSEGFHDIIPHNLVQMFDERELEYLLCGLGEINVGDWRLNTQYRSGYHDKHVVIQWFWKAVSTFDNEMKARLLQFVTGTSRVPMNGFAELYGSNGPQKFAIERWGNSNQLPRSHTCFNRLDLPPYLSYHELREKLRLAIENTEGFEGVD